MFKFNKANRNAIFSILFLIALIMILGMTRNTSRYQPRPITIDVVNDQSLFDLKPGMECTPGSGKEDDAYTVGLTPGGLCGAQKLVGEHAGYSITGGIGGSLI